MSFFSMGLVTSRNVIYNQVVGYPVLYQKHPVQKTERGR